MSAALLLKSLSDLLFPRHCVACGQRLSVGEQHLCAACLLRLARVHADWTGSFRAEQWFACREVERVVGFAWFKHDSITARLVHRLKYGARPELGLWMGRTAAQELLPTGAFEGVEVLLPVPLSRKRHRQRGYNQAEKIALGIGMATGLPVCTDAVQRVVHAESQTRFGREQRMENAAHVFKLVDASQLEGRHVMLVDDVMTTGATMDGMVEQLRGVPGIRITIFAWAWTTD